MVRFTIQDTGIGIAKDQLPNVFQSFTQADSSITRKYGGTGLGLTISKKLVEAMGGQHLGGERASALAPRSSSLPASDLARPLQSPRLHGTRHKPSALGARLRILVADDSEDNRFLIRSYLKLLPFQLDFAENGAIAFEKLQKNGAYDLALVDVHMPEMDGYAVARRVRDHESRGNNKTLPLIALTADRVPERDREKCGRWVQRPT